MTHCWLYHTIRHYTLNNNYLLITIVFIVKLIIFLVFFSILFGLSSLCVEKTTVARSVEAKSSTLGSTLNVALYGLWLIPECQTKFFINRINCKPYVITLTPSYYLLTMKPTRSPYLDYIVQLALTVSSFFIY